MQNVLGQHTSSNRWLHFSPGCKSFLAFLCAFLALAVFAAREGGAASLTPQQKRGKHIYLKTTSPSDREIIAFFGKDAIRAPGSAFACVNCHQRDGRGFDEMGITATDLTWEDLTKPYGFKRAKGRQHPAYTEASFARALTDGIDPAGNMLDHTMPRYRMASEDIADLIAYLKVISSALDPGISDTLIKVGTVLPVREQFAGLGQAMRAVMEAYFKEINSYGGVFNRKIELQVAEYAGTAESTVTAFETLIDRQESFAILSAFSAGADSAVADLMEIEQVPLIGPFTLFPEDVYALNRYTFYLFSGLREQARALLTYAWQNLSGLDRGIAVAYPEPRISGDFIEAIERQTVDYSWPQLAKIAYGPEGFDAFKTARKLHAAKTAGLLFLGSWEELRSLIRAADALGWTPRIFTCGSQVKKDIFALPARFSHNIFISYPTLPNAQTNSGIREFEQLADKYHLSRQHLAAQISAYCSAKILVEGLKKAGRQLSRETLVDQLDKLYEFKTGLTPPSTYTPNRRIGAMGAYVVTVDLEKKAFVPISPWIALE